MSAYLSSLNPAALLRACPSGMAQGLISVTEGMEATLKWGAVRLGTAAHINLGLLLNAVWS